MGIFKNLTTEDVAMQHQLLIEMLLQILCATGGDHRHRAAAIIESRIAQFRDAGMDTTIFEVTLSQLQPRRAQG